MPNVYPDIARFAFSFSHASITLADKQYTGISGVSISQDLQDAPVYGTSRGPLKRSAGQIQMGAGQVVFSDYEEGTDFFRSLSPDPYMKLWTLEYVLVLETGTVRQVECQACRLLGIGIDHQSGSEALGVTYPFSFLKMKVDGAELALSAKAIAGAALSAAGNILARL